MNDPVQMRAQQIKRTLRSGTYRIDARQVADAVLHSDLGPMLTRGVSVTSRAGNQRVPQTHR